MDWPLAGAVAGAVVVCGAVAAGGVALLQSSAGPVHKTAPTAVRLFPSGPSPGIAVSSNQSMLVPSSSSAALSPSVPQPPISPFAIAPPPPRLLPAEQAFVSDDANPLLQRRPAAPARRTEASNYALRQTSPESGGSPHWQVANAQPPTLLHAPKPAPGGIKLPHVEGGIQQIGPPQWRAVPTAKASYFNLGGHLDRNGVVDSLASPHLRDAFKAHRNYPRLPAHAKALIDAPNINLSKLAPYRALLGINDRTIEEEQGVRFERIASTRTADTTGAGSSYRGVDGDAPGAAELDAVEPVAVEPGEFAPLVLPPFK